MPATPPKLPDVYAFRYGGKGPLINAGGREGVCRLDEDGREVLGTRKDKCCCPTVEEEQWAKFNACAEMGECEDPPASHVYVPVSYWPDELPPPQGTVLLISGYCWTYTGIIVDELPPDAMVATPDNEVEYEDCETCCQVAECSECVQGEEPPNGCATSYAILIEDNHLVFPGCGGDQNPRDVYSMLEMVFDYACYNSLATWRTYASGECSAQNCSIAECSCGSTYFTTDPAGIYCTVVGNVAYWTIGITVTVQVGEEQVHVARTLFRKAITEDEPCPIGVYEFWMFESYEYYNGTPDTVTLIDPGVCHVS